MVGIPRSRGNSRYPKSKKHKDNFLEWVQGVRKPTLKQLDDFAKHVHVPTALLFMDEPPEPDPVPVSDFRTLGSKIPEKLSFNLRSAIENAKYQQSWYEEALEADGVAPLSFVGSVDETHSPILVAEQIRRALRLDTDPIKSSDVVVHRKELTSRIEDLGVVVQIRGSINGNRSLDVSEFRGFSLASQVAPFIFVNGQDSYPAQTFTLIHELAHIWAGQNVLSVSSKMDSATNPHEIWANEVAAHTLITESEFVAWWNDTKRIEDIRKFAKQHGVSGEVVIRHANTLGVIDRTRQDELISEWYEQSQRDSAAKKGGNYYLIKQWSLGKPLIQEVIRSTRDGSLSYRDALNLLGVKTVRALNTLGEKIGA